MTKQLVETREVVANTCSDPISNGVLNFFPSIAELDVRLSDRIISLLLVHPSELYASLSEAISTRVASHFSIPHLSARVLMREPVVVLAACFLDRLVRASELMRRNTSESLSVASSPPLTVPVSLEELLSSIGSSKAFNQDVVARVLAIWDVRIVVRSEPQEIPPSLRVVGARNFNFRSPTIVQRAIWKMRRMAGNVLGRVPALDLAYAEPDLLEGGLVGPGFLALLREPLPEENVETNYQIRVSLLTAACSEIRPVFKQLMLALDIANTVPLEKIETAFLDYLLAYFPLTRLEGLPKRFDFARSRLQRFEGRDVLFSGCGSTHTAYFLAAAVSLGMRVTGVQHGAHYGFAEAPCITELEFPHCERFVTWGATTIDRGRTNSPIKSIPLPSPWLSEKRYQWLELQKSRTGKKRKWDLILLTDRILPFPSSIATLRMFRTDLIHDSRAWLYKLVSTVCQDGFRVLHKPFNVTAAEIFRDVIERLKLEYGDSYFVYPNLDKGVTEDLVENGRVFVFDEPGSGLFECLVSGIPAMSFWPYRLFRVPSAAAPYLDELRAVGVIHFDLESLLSGIKDCLEAPEMWVENPERRAAVERACRALAWTDVSWRDRWKDFLRSCRQGRAS